MPVVGDIINRAQLSRFARTFALMIRAGVPLNQAIQLSAEALENRFLENRLVEMKNGIEGGSSITQTASQSGIFTPLVLQMIAVGEETGQVDELLHEVSDFYDREVDYDLKTLTARIEPFLLAVVAGMAVRPGKSQLVQAMVGLAHNLDLDVVAEGVETTEQLELLRQFGAQQVQGYLVSQPLPLAELLHFMSAERLAAGLAH